jgi:GT2 family glycosyltransferase
MSHDNVLNPNFLHTFKLIAENTEEKYDIFFSDYNLISENGEFIKRKKAGPVSKLILGNFIGASFLYKQEVYDKLKGYDKKIFLAEDHDFFLRASLKFNFRKVEEVLYNYRIHSKSLTSGIDQNPQYNAKLIKSLERMYSRKEFELNRQTRNFLISMRTGEASIQDYLVNRKIIRKDLKNFQNKTFKLDLNELNLDILIYWYYKVKEHRPMIFFKVLYQAPELILSNYKIAGRILVNSIKTKYSNSSVV